MRGVCGCVEERSLKGLNSSDDGYGIVRLGSEWCGWVGGGMVSVGS